MQFFQLILVEISFKDQAGSLVIEATEFSYQDDPAILAQIDHFMND